MEMRYDLRKIGIPHDEADLNAHDAARLLIKEIERLRDERLQSAFKIIEDEARISMARRYVIRVNNEENC